MRGGHIGKLGIVAASLWLVVAGAAACGSSASVGDACSSADACGEDGWCDFQPSTCAGEGVCRERPGACATIYQPTCGCDGMVYGNACDAQSRGVDVNLEGGCAPPDSGMFPCGSSFCNLATQYCEIVGSDIGGEDAHYACQSLPGSCGDTPSCACLSMERCTGRCEGDAASGLTTVCLGG